jgi:ribose transport system substrate-binding protein
MRSLKVSVGVVVLLIAALAFSACGSSDDSSTGSTAASTAAAADTGTTAGADTTAAAEEPWLADAKKAAASLEQVPTEVSSSQLGPNKLAPEGSKTIFHIAFSQAFEGAKHQTEGLKAGVEAMGYKFKLCDGGTAPNETAPCFTQAVNEKPAAVVINGFDAKTDGDGYAALAKAGIPIIGMNTGNPPGVDGVATEVAQDLGKNEGTAMADYVIADTDGKANVLFLGTTFTTNEDREAAFKAEIAKCTTCKFTTLEFPIDGIQSKLPQQLQAALQSNPDINWIVGTPDAAALAAADAVRQAGKADSIKVGGFDADAPNVALIEKGDIVAADIRSGTDEPGWIAADAAARAINGDKLPAILPVSMLIVTKNNLADGKNYKGAAGYEDTFKQLWGKG